MSGLVRPEGTLAVMSSALGSVSGNTDGGHEVNRASKAALNTLMRSYQARAGAGRSPLASMPGWVRTDMGGPNAAVDVPTSTKGLADTIAVHAGKAGLSFVDYLNQPISG